ncbi:MAG: hypothetical protein JWN00_1186 [Actinomycetia bacterium]|jgi:hypothetical protein|nr:hypothetical protein [Actinomycetes bacterium]
MVISHTLVRWLISLVVVLSREDLSNEAELLARYYNRAFGWS